MKQITLKKQQILILAIAVGLTILAGYYYLLLGPKVSSLGRLISQTGQLKRQLREAKSEIADLERLSHKNAELQKKWDDLKGSFLKEGQVSSLLKELSGIATDSGVKIVRIEPIEEKTPPTSFEAGKEEVIYREVPILVEARAGFHQSGRFINRLETGQLFVKVKDLDITQDPDSPTVHKVSFKVCVLVFEGE